MTDSSSLANTLSEPLRQPFWWAALASVGIHGVLGVSAPTISNIIYGGGNSSKNIPGSVGLVELTPAEAGRLPQTIPPQPSKTPFSLVAPVPLPTSPKLAPPLPPAPPEINLPALPPGMPPPGFFAPLDPPLGPLTAPIAPQPPKTPAASLPTPSVKTPTFVPQAPPSGLIFPPLPSNFDRNIPPPPSGLTPAPQFPGNQDEGESLEKLRNAQGRLALFPDGAPVFSPQFPITGRNPGLEEAPKLTQKDPNKRNLITETPEERIRRQQFDRGQQQLDFPAQPGSNLPSDRETQLAAANTYVALFERFKKAYPDLEMTGPTPVNVAYPKEACSQKLEGVAVFGAVVNPQGLLKAEPQAIVPTGYGILDNAAKNAIINPALTFPANSTHKLYQVAVAFKYDEKVCSGIPVSPSTTPTSPAGPQPLAPAPTAPNPTAQPPSPAPAQVKPQFEKPPAPSNKPQPGAQQSPQPAPKPATKPSPSPQPKPAAEQSPSPQPKPAPEVSPSPEAAPSPAPEVSPSPAPEVSPSPAPEVSPSGEVAPSPESTPSPAAEVAPSPAPSPATAN
ncbi:energy transducer TonB [Microcoleus sp. herbarium12]|uniref:energy transducer TonB n=1 Tax=Microcoleus sp. herbarium12 TaxID=3055437 RepID=UPI002FD5AB34